MTAEDELPLPHVPEARPEDPEDVSWALSTAEAMWARGDHLEGIKWVRKAAEAASEVEDDQRALDLAKAASELATIVARRSQASVADANANAATAAPPPDASFADTSNSVPVSVQPMSGQPVSAMPTTTRSQMPPPPPTPVSLPPAPLSPLPSGLRPSTQPTSRPMSQPPPRAPLTSRPAVDVPRRPLSNPPRANAQAPFPSASKAPKPRRKSRDNFDAEAHPAGAITDTAPLPAIDGDRAGDMLRDAETPRDLDATAVGISPFTGRPAASSARPRRRSNRPASEPEATVIARFEDLQLQREKSAAPPLPVDWDRSPTQSLSAAELDLPRRSSAAPRPQTPVELEDATDRKTAFTGAPVATAAPSHAPPRSVQPAVHDPAIQTTQAVRVVVWRDANGVHVAPAGTVVSAITIDAVLVVLDEGADLTAWLSQRER